MIAYFGADNLKVNDMKNGHSNYATPRIQIGELEFYFTFYFFNKIIQSVSFVLYPKPLTVQAATDIQETGWEYFDEQKNIQEGKFMEKWMTNQLKLDINAYNWGRAGTSYDFHNCYTSCRITYAQQPL